MIDPKNARQMPIIARPDTNQAYILTQMMAWATARRAWMNPLWPAAGWRCYMSLDLYRLTCLDKWGIWTVEVRALHSNGADLTGRAYHTLLTHLTLTKIGVETDLRAAEPSTADSLKSDLAQDADALILKRKDSERYQRTRRQGHNEFLDSPSWLAEVVPLFSLELAPQQAAPLKPAKLRTEPAPAPQIGLFGEVLL